MAVALFYIYKKIRTKINYKYTQYTNNINSVLFSSRIYVLSRRIQETE